MAETRKQRHTVLHWQSKPGLIPVQSFKCTVRGVMTDNKKKMEVMRHELKEANNDLVVYGCSSHLLNQLGEDLTPSQITKQMVEVYKYFCNHHRVAAMLDELSNQGAVKPQLVGVTRWHCQRRCMETFLRNTFLYDDCSTV